MSYLTDFRVQRNVNGWKPTGGDTTDDIRLIKQLQKQVNRFVGTAVPTAIGENGILGSGTVSAVRKVASFLIAQGAVTSDSFVQSGASASAAYIAKNISAYISTFDKAATARGITHPDKYVPLGLAAVAAYVAYRHFFGSGRVRTVKR